MWRRARRAHLATFVVAVGVAGAMLAAQPVAPDLVLFNAKVATLDERGRMAQAVAIRGDRILAVGSDEDARRWGSATTRRIDVSGRTVVPGLIDNHMHLLRASTTWPWEVRLDGVDSRAAGLDLLRARARTTRAGEWIYTLGGWTIDQFADDSRPFSRQELDRAVPDHPVLLQASYYQTFVNSRAADLLGLDATTSVVDESGLRPLVAKLPAATGERLEAGTKQLVRDLHAMGLTSVGSAACEPDVLPLYQRLQAAGQLNLRVFCITGFAPGTPAQVDQVLPQIGLMRPTDSGALFGQVAYGETVYGPLHDPMFVESSKPRADQLTEWRRVVTEVARARLTLHVHANLTATIGAFLDQVEAVNATHSIRDLRWAFAHLNQVGPSHLARMKRLGMHAAVHPWAVINGGINQRVFGSAAADMAPLRDIEASGVPWGLGSDGTRANQIQPFTTLWWAVTGRMVGGRTVLRQTISREAALAAHTRGNAAILFREKDLGTIEPGKLADVVVLDRDYFTIPADDIRHVRPVMTLVGGKVVHDAAVLRTVLKTVPMPVLRPVLRP
jgi:predicted amidohydrolase YtcJ